VVEKSAVPASGPRSSILGNRGTSLEGLAPTSLFIAWISRTRARSTLRAVERDGRNLIVRLTRRVFVLGGILGQERPLAARLLGHLRLSAALLTPERALSVASGSTPKQRGFAVCR
jgi:hypothetical protein